MPHINLTLVLYVIIYFVNMFVIHCYLQTIYIFQTTMCNTAFNETKVLFITTGWIMKYPLCSKIFILHLPLQWRHNERDGVSNHQPHHFLAATKQLYEWLSLSVCPSVCLSVCLRHLFHYVPILLSSWNFLGLLPMTEVMSMQKVKVRGQRSRSHRSQINVTVSGP